MLPRNLAAHLGHLGKAAQDRCGLVLRLRSQERALQPFRTTRRLVPVASTVSFDTFNIFNTKAPSYLSGRPVYAAN